MQAHTETGDGTGSAAADAGQAGQAFNAARKLAAVFADQQLCGLMQVAGAAVIAKTGPQVQHLVQLAGGQAGQIGKSLHEPLEVAQYSVYLGLLQHDFRHPNPVGADVLLPGQVFAAVLCGPGQHSCGKRYAGHLRNRPFRASLRSGLTLSLSFSSIFSVSLSPARRVAIRVRPSWSIDRKSVV